MAFTLAINKPIYFTIRVLQLSRYQPCPFKTPYSRFSKILGTLHHITTRRTHKDIFKNRNRNDGLVLHKSVSRKRGAMLTDSFRTKISQSRSSIRRPRLLMSEGAGLTWGKGKRLTYPLHNFSLTSSRLGQIKNKKTKHGRPVSRLGWPSRRSRSDTGWQARREKPLYRAQQENDTQSNMTGCRLCLYNTHRCSLVYATGQNNTSRPNILPASHYTALEELMNV